MQSWTTATAQVMYAEFSSDGRTRYLVGSKIGPGDLVATRLFQTSSFYAALPITSNALGPIRLVSCTLRSRRRPRSTKPAC